MRDSDTVDVELADVAVGEGDVRRRRPGWYTERLGFWWGGGGVAAVWLGGALGVLDALRAASCGSQADPSRLAHLGALHASVAASPCSARRDRGRDRRGSDERAPDRGVDLRVGGRADLP